MGSHYSNVQQAAVLAVKSKLWAKWIIKHCTKRAKGQVIYPVFIYTGLSGIGSATALALALNEVKKDFTYGMIYVRKPNERSHGSRIENECSNDNDLPVKYVFVDDFISSGVSAARAVRTALYYYNRGQNQNFNFEQATVVEMMYKPDEVWHPKDDAYGRLSKSTLKRIQGVIMEMERIGDSEYPKRPKFNLYYTEEEIQATKEFLESW